MSGFGVCQTVVGALATVASANQHTMHSGQRTASTPTHWVAPPQQMSMQQTMDSSHSHSSHSHAANHNHATMSAIQATKVDTGLQAIPVPKQVVHHFSHSACGFCTLYGHSIPPPLVLPLLASSIQRDFITLDDFLYNTVYAVFTPYLKPQSHAPPFII